MTQNTVYVRATRAAVRAAIAALPTAMHTSAADAIMTRCGLALLGRIKQAFIIKARGGVDEAGDSWKPLSPKTIAYSKTRQRGRGGRTKAEKGRSAFPSQALSNKQQERWWQLYRRYLAAFKGDKGHAAAAAWIVGKREGMTTLLNKYGHRQVEILRDTGLLLNSLSPGVNSAEQIFRVGHGQVIVGTNRKGAASHHAGIPGRLPQRRLWPPVNKWPASWWQDILEQASQGILDLAMLLIKGTNGP